MPRRRKASARPAVRAPGARGAAPRAGPPPAAAGRGAYAEVVARLGAEKQRAEAALASFREQSLQQNHDLMSVQQALEESRDRYASLFDYAPVALLSLRRNGIIEGINLHGAELLESTRPRLLGLPLMSFITRDDHKTFLNHLFQCRRQHDAVQTELRMRTRQGRIIPVMLSAWMTAAHSRPEYEFRTAIVDLSERQEAERREAEYQARLRSLASELSLAEERERRRIAVEIHDNISQSLAMAKMRLDGVSHKLGASGPRGELTAVVKLVETVLADTRSLTFELSPPVLYELGLAAALEWLGERAGASHKLEVRVETPRQPLAPPPHDVAILMYQAVRELLMNIGKHARARRAWVRMWQADGQLRLYVEDDGRGFGAMAQPRRGGAAAGPNGKVRADGWAAAPSPSDSGFGLFSIRTRLEHLGGSMGIETRPEGGGRVTMAVPLEQEHERMLKRAAVTSAGAQESGAHESGTETGHTSYPIGPRDGRKTQHESIDRGRPPHGARGIA
jgi:PAS domain S-box-containing protein